jgi:predicted transcriptional regulator
VYLLGLLVKQYSTIYIQKKLMEIAVYMLGRGYVCSFHSKIDPELDPKRCRICIELFGES